MAHGGPRAGAWLVSPDDRKLAQFVGVEPDGRYALEDAHTAEDGVNELILLAPSEAKQWREITPASNEEEAA